jgi:hypothetical protein
MRAERRADEGWEEEGGRREGKAAGGKKGEEKFLASGRLG